MDFAAFLGRLAGSALNPVVWAIVAGVLYWTREWPWFFRIASSVTATVIVGLALYTLAHDLSPYEKARGLMFGGIVALIISSLWVAIRRR